MITRVWHGWTTQALADSYEGLLKGEVFPSILAKRIPGFLHIELFRRELEHETEFMTVMWFASQNAVSTFVGEDHGVAYVPASARLVLAHFDERAAHYKVRASRNALAATIGAPRRPAPMQLPPPGLASQAGFAKSSQEP